MQTEILIDAMRFTHFIGLALGIGAGSFADWSLVRKLNTEVTSCDIGNLEVVHRIVWVGLGLLWLSGLGLLYARTGFVMAEFSPKLITKLTVVMILTVNAVMLGSFAMPILRRNVNRAYMAFSLEHKTVLCLLASISLSSWISGLILGIFSSLKMANFELILPIFVVIYTAGLFGAIMMTIFLHIVWEKRSQQTIHTVEHRKKDKPIVARVTDLPERRSPSLAAAGIDTGILHVPVLARDIHSRRKIGPHQPAARMPELSGA